METATAKIVVIGAGIGGLSAALRLAHAGHEVTVLDMHGAPGGKMRTFPSLAGPVDAGPTVLTMRGVFDDLFADVGEDIADHVTLEPLHTLARHYWADGESLDLMADPAASVANITAAFGPTAAAQFQTFSARAARLFAAFDAPMMQSSAPTRAALTARVLRQPRLIVDMAPWKSLAGLLRHSFSDPRLAQLFGRYATYVGGMPDQVPALLSLIWQAEAAGVWAVAGGMQQLAQAIADLAVARGAVFHYATKATRIERQHGRVAAVQTADSRFPADIVLFNGDPRALTLGLLSPNLRDVLPRPASDPRSLSACVLAFAATPNGPPLAHHTVFFGDDRAAEFADLARGHLPRDPTLYICAQDRGSEVPTGPERFEIILNAPPLPHADPKETARCTTEILARLARFGLTFSPTPQADTLTTPAGFDLAFPGSAGALYGRSPAGLMAAFKRPTARTGVPGLYLCGGGTHPGAGVPMATLSGRHAAGAIMADLGSTSPSRRTGMRGGMSTGSAPTAPARSVSSDS